ncbi:MAG: glycosyltransferase family 2 protein [Bacteroidales bacterium]|nr:glycosyltransferase family 2 protein [Fibrobacter sp.]MBR3387225.1 glycosyltransferase family 2 protein [Bacteroidales bacterium]
MASSFSIIIPHRDCPGLLQRCLDSIPVRDDIQVLVIDDNSNPTIVDFNHFPGHDRADVKVVLTKEGKGAGYARNIGLEYAKGDWVIFSDADDYFISAELSRLCELDLPEEADVVLYQYKYYHEDGSFHIYPEIVDSSLSVCFDTNILCRDAVMPWTKMVRRKFLDKNHIRFEEVKWGNDMIYSTQLSLAVDSFFIAPLLVYSHEWLPNSLVNKDPGLEMFYKRALLSLKRAKLLQSGNRLNYNIFRDQWFRRIYSLDYFHSLCLMFRCVFELGPKYCIRNWREYTHKPLYLTRLFVKRLISIL